MKTFSKLSQLGLVSCLLIATLSFSSTELVVYFYSAMLLSGGAFYLARKMMKTESQTKTTETTVLLVDDENDILDTIEFAFHKQGISVFKASNGAEAMAIVAKNHINVVVSDIYMPGMGGFDLARRIKNEVTDPPAVFLMTGAVEMSQEKAHEAGAKAVLTKFHIESTLLDTLKNELAIA